MVHPQSVNQNFIIYITMEKFVRVECIEVEEMTKKEFMKKMLGKEEDSLEEGYLIKDESGHMGWISQSDFEKKKYMSCNALPYPLAYYMLQEKKAGYIRMPQWKEDVKIKAQFPDEHSKMTHPYTYVESRFGNCPHKTTVVEEWAKNWQLAPEGFVTSCVGCITQEGVFIPKADE